MSDKQRIELNREELKQKFNLETGQMSWQELQRFFARGDVIIAGPDLDLIETAVQLAEDNKSAIESLIRNSEIVRASDEHAEQWNTAGTHFWAVVISPWVLVQEMPPGNTE